jgi:hypothetical protein
MQACAEAQQQPLAHAALVAHDVPIGASVTTSAPDASTTPVSRARDASLDIAASLDGPASIGIAASPTKMLEPKGVQALQRAQPSIAFRPRTL